MSQDKFSKSEKLEQSKTSIPFRFATMTSFTKGDKPPIPYEKMFDQLVQQMTDMDEKEIKNIANIIVR